MPTSPVLSPASSFLHGHCNKGKQQQFRGGLGFAIPASVQAEDFGILLQCRRQAVGYQRGPSRHASRAGYCGGQRHGDVNVQLASDRPYVCPVGADEAGGDGRFGRLADSVRYPKCSQHATALFISQEGLSMAEKLPRQDRQVPQEPGHQEAGQPDGV